MVRPRRKFAAGGPRHEGSSGVHFRKIAELLAEIGRDFYRRGWVFGTSGNFSAVTSREPLRLAITTTGLDKGTLRPADMLEIDAACRVTRGKGMPSAESLVHLTIVGMHRAGAVLHTHSIWSTILSDAFAPQRGLALEGFEMLKGLDGVSTHEHREWLPILENSQDMKELAQTAEKALAGHPRCHGFLIRRHGMYTWGVDLAEAKRHVEILEFLLEVVGRARNTVARE
jgi:methylthioribulose-1-phosphate dehydratase